MINLINVLYYKQREPCNAGVHERLDGYLLEEGIIEYEHSKIKLTRLGPDRVYKRLLSEEIDTIYRDFEYEYVE